MWKKRTSKKTTRTVATLGAAVEKAKTPHPHVHYKALRGYVSTDLGMNKEHSSGTPVRL